MDLLENLLPNPANIDDLLNLTMPSLLSMQDHFQHKLAAYISQQQKSKTAHRPAHRCAPAPPMEMVPNQQHPEYCPRDQAK